MNALYTTYYFLVLVVYIIRMPYSSPLVDHWRITKLKKDQRTQFLYQFATSTINIKK